MVRKVVDNKKYVFVGNRFYVLEQMLKKGCNIVRIYAVRNSYLEKYLVERNISYCIIENKQLLINEIIALDFDILVSNGCPFILPVSKMKKNSQKYINIHPSLLPDLKGKNPINGCILFGRKHGVTCHYMDDGIDTGEIISQIEIPVTDELDIELLYQISFRAEGKAFAEAYEKNFEYIEIEPSNLNKHPIYYSRSDEDLLIKKKDGLDGLLNKVKAFSIPGLYARVKINDNLYSVIDACIIKHPLLEEWYSDTNKFENKILFVTKKKILVMFSNNLCWLTLEGTENLSENSTFLSD